MASQIICKIKQARRNLAIFSSPIRAILPSDSNRESIQSKSDEDIIDETQVLFDIRAPFARSYNLLLKQHELIETLQSNPNAELKQINEYIKSNGDFTAELSQASELLLKLDSTIEKLMNEGRSRDLPMADFNDEALSTTTGKSATHIPQPLPRNRNSIQYNIEQQANQISATDPISEANFTGSSEQKVIYVNDSTNAFVTASLIGKTLPQFSGDILQWSEFFESFDCLIRHGNITGADKLALLRMCLTHEALEIISGFSRIDRNYDHAIALLKKEYDRPHLRHHALLSKLRNLPECDSEGTQLRSLYLQLNVLIRQLLPNGELDAPDLLINLVTSKLPIAMQTHIIKESSRKPTFGIFNVLSIIAESVEDEKIEREIMANNKVVHSSSEQLPTNAIEQSSHAQFPTPITHHRFSNHNPRSCRLCDGSHFEQHCTEHVTPTDRSIAVKQRQLCANCLFHGHVASECRNQKRCQKCNGLHHTSICTNPI